MLKRKQNILLIGIAFIFGQLPAYYLYIVNTDWNMPLWNVVLEVTTIIIGITIIILVLRHFLNKLDASYTEEEDKQTKRDARLAKMLKTAFKEALEEDREEQHKEKNNKAGDW